MGREQGQGGKKRKEKITMRNETFDAKKDVKRKKF